MLEELRSEAVDLFARSVPDRAVGVEGPAQLHDASPSGASCLDVAAGDRARAPKPARDRRVARDARRSRAASTASRSGSGICADLPGCDLRPAGSRSRPTTRSSPSRSRGASASAEFLGDTGVANARRCDAAEALGFVGTELRHSAFTPEDVAADPAVSSAQRELCSPPSTSSAASTRALSLRRTSRRRPHDRGAPRRAAAPAIRASASIASSASTHASSASSSSSSSGVHRASSEQYVELRSTRARESRVWARVRRAEASTPTTSASATSRSRSTPASCRRVFLRR